MKIIVTGANGQLGNEIRLVASCSVSNEPSHEYIFTDVNQIEGQETIYLDITDLEAVRAIVKSHAVAVRVNRASYTNLDAAESDEQLAEKLNAVAPENLAIAMKETGGLLIHISTDYVFGDKQADTPYNEDRKTNPVSVYGRTKLLGEQRIVGVGCDYVIIRTAWLYSEFGKNFCKTMMNLTSSRPLVKVVNDQIGTPTYALDLAYAISVILSDYSDNRVSVPYLKSGIYHYSNEGVCTWYEFARMIAHYSGNVDCDINPCTSEEYPSPVKRPSYSVLDKTKIKAIFGVNVPYWTDSLERCINNIKHRS